MKLHDDGNPSLNTVTAYGEGFIEINQTRFEQAIAFGPEGSVNAWPAHDASDISSDLLMQACGLSQVAQDPMAFLDADENSPILDPNRPEVLLVGTGKRQVLLGTPVLTPLLRAGIGVECMSTGAAARTYNILMAEGRRVIAALILEKP
ncbi:MAG: Mth938-like domain-containing protein [Burkholderiaceae bacterium]|nr:Mth938-like domain-containing protein [Burkholderiaceae bacterium]MCD8516381.1 Mth938-like domain-containing protein [Burkholderiaceae bacterium]MCD8538221.1 Mth938-like domain-containing protein [Burkholderiaceae bacterium]MCD8565759.1 Mth938-like domain-containing protein [Burkholderiaceae bacterium]